MRGSLEETDRGLLHFMFSYLWLIKTVTYNYFIHYIVVYAIIALFIWLALTRKKMKIIFSDNGYRFIWLSVLPVVLLHIFFLNYSVQDFTVLYASLFFSVLIGILYDKVKKSGAVNYQTLRVGVGITVLLFILQYHMMNNDMITKLFSMQQKQRLDYRNDIATTVSKDEVVFILNRAAEPQDVFYAQRNIRYANSVQDAVDFLNWRHLSKSVIFEYKTSGTAYGLQKDTVVNLGHL